jgi:hypothetical protein
MPLLSRRRLVVGECTAKTGELIMFGNMNGDHADHEPTDVTLDSWVDACVPNPPVKTTDRGRPRLSQGKVDLDGRSAAGPGNGMIWIAAPGACLGLPRVTLAGVSGRKNRSWDDPEICHGSSSCGHGAE